MSGGGLRFYPEDGSEYTEGDSDLATARHDDDVVTLPTPVGHVVPVRPLRADARRNYDRLLTAAAAAFAGLGPDAPLEQIARDAGVGIGTLYRHFPSRETLMAAVVQDTFEQLQVRAADGLTAADPFAALEDWMRAYLAFATTKRGLVAGVVLLKEGGGEFAAICDRLFDALDDLVDRARAAGQLRVGVSGRDLLHLAGSLGNTAGNGGDPTMPERLLEIALAGLKSQGSAPPVTAQ